MQLCDSNKFNLLNKSRQCKPICCFKVEPKIGILKIIVLQKNEETENEMSFLVIFEKSPYDLFHF